MTVTLNDLAKDEQGNFRVLGSATLGGGTRKVYGVGETQEAATEAARYRAEQQERWLAANETHDVDVLAEVAREGHRTLRAPDGTLVEATEATVPALLAAGYTESQGIPQRTNETAGPVGIVERKTRRKATEDEME